MEMRYRFLADAATVEAGKFNVLGGGVTILWRSEFPAVAGFSVVFGLEYHPAEAGQTRNVRLLVNDADGQSILPPIDGPLPLQPAPVGTPKGVPLGGVAVLRIDGPVIPSAGMYAIEILIDGNYVDSIPFVVAPRPLAEAA